MMKWYSISLYTMMIMFKHPLIMVLSIIAASISSSILSYPSMMSQWINYILILTFLGGVMVLFMYMASLTPNEKFLSKNKMFLFLMFISMMIIEGTNKENSLNNFMVLMYSSMWVTIFFMAIIISSILVYIMMIIFEPFNPLKSKK